MVDESKKYKYDSDKQIFKELFVSFDDYFKPLFKSFGICKKTFILQVVNFVLVFTLIYLIFGNIFDKIISQINGSALYGMKLLLLLLVICVISAFQENRVLRWQTLFETTYILTKKYFYRILFIICCVYLGKELYGKRNQE